MHSVSSSAHRHPAGHAELIRKVHEIVPSMTSFLATLFPRGEFQLMQPPHAGNGALKGYAHDLQREDAVAWRAVTGGKAVRASDVWEDAAALEATRFYQAFLRPAGLAHVMAAPLRGPLFEGYPGVLWVARSREMGEFTDAEVGALTELADQVNQASVHTHAANCPRAAWSHRPACRVFVFDQQGRQWLPGADAASQVDAKLAEELRRAAAERIAQDNGERYDTRRVALPDTEGDLWTFRAVRFGRLPALGDGPFVVLCLLPECCDWTSVHPADLIADAELSRLVPAAHFMQDEFRRGPTLGEIAKTVHLSPFHFHRRFTELFGQTPKHFLLECQIYAAKQELAAREKDLSKIATDCGFAHQSHFTSRFKQATGLTPTRWRRIAVEGR